MEKIYLVKYSGPFAFIKPWTAVRDSETFSQQFLTPSIVAGIERKLFPELLQNDDGEIKKIVGHRLNYQQISQQQEQVQPRGWNTKGTSKNRTHERPYSITLRGVFTNPILFLAFDIKEDALIASQQHICLCRNEDILYPDSQILEVTQEEFDENTEDFAGFELVFEQDESSFHVGYNRLKHAEPMYGSIKVVGNPIRTNY